MKLTFLNRQYLDLDQAKFSDVFIDIDYHVDYHDRSLIDHVIFNYPKYILQLQKLVINI